MVKVGLSFIAAYLLLGIVSVALFLFVVPIETTKDIYASIPAALIGPSIKKETNVGHFSEAGDLLNRQADLSQLMGFSETMKQNLVAQTFDVVESARNKSQFENLLPWLERLIEIFPNSLLANLMLADARLWAGKIVDENKLLELREVSPSLDIIYRSAIDQATRQHKGNLIAKWCRLYRTSQLGALNPATFRPSRAPGQGLGGFFLEVIDNQGEIVVSGNFGIQLNEVRNYEFEAYKLPGQSRLILQLPTLPGLKVTVQKINFITRGSKVSFSGEDIVLLPRRGFVVAENQILVTSAAGDTLAASPKSGIFPPSDKIELVLEFSRLALSNDSACLVNSQ